jgi:hypothetical protein
VWLGISERVSVIKVWAAQNKDVRDDLVREAVDWAYEIFLEEVVVTG